MGIGQGSALSLILSTLYIASIFHIFEKRSKNILPNIPVFFLSFIDDSLFISQEKAIKNQIHIFFVVITLFPLLSINLDL